MKKKSTKDYLRLLTDIPLSEAGVERKDGLGFSSYATVLAKAAMGTPGPFTIGIFGEWGTGKTSLMRMIKDELPSDESIVIWFNAWQFEKEEHPIVPLVATILQEIEKNKSFREKLNDKGKSIIRALRAIAYGFSGQAEIELPGFAKLEASFVMKDMIDRNESLTPDPLVERSLYYKAFETLNDAPLPENIRIVVLIDDLDRCFPDKAIRMLESIKLVLSQKGFIFILGVARTVLEGYLQHRYENKYGLKNFRGSAYLDKIVQLAFPIPSHSGRMQKLAKVIAEHLEPSQRNDLESVIPFVAEYLGANPRALVRFINNIIIDVEIASTTYVENVTVDLFAITRCLQMRWKNFYDEVVFDSSIAEFAAKLDNKEFQNMVGDSSSPFNRVSSMLLSDSRLYSLVSSSPCQKWLMDHDGRKQAVLFLKESSRDVEIKKISKNERTVLLVVAGDKDVEMNLANEIRRQEVKFSENHRTYPWFEWSQEDTKNLILLVIGNPKDAKEKINEARKFNPETQIFYRNPNGSDNWSKEEAIIVLRNIYGDPYKNDDEI